jgi:transcriptional regulator with XRE-family HTH domain
MMFGDINMSIYGMSDRAILTEIGRRLKRKRLEKNYSQEKLAGLAGINRTTVSDIEQGSPSGVLTLVRILRALEVLDELDSFLPDPGISPLQLAKMKGKERRRASRQTREDQKGKSSW